MKLTQRSFLCVFVLLIASSGAFAQQFGGQDQQTQRQVQGSQNPTQQAISQQRLAEQQRLEQQRAAQMTAQQPQRPFPELDAEHIQFIDDLLDHWQKTSGQVNLYTCEFRRWDYDPTFCNYRDPATNRLAAFSIADGKVRYASPDKGMFETTSVWDFAGPPEQEGGDAKYEQRESEAANHEKWICDGRSIFEFDFKNKVLYEVEIPDEMQGNGLANSPLPFLFGVDKELLKERYWLRVITPQGVQDEYWLEAWPKKIDDARTYKKLEIILAAEDFLPKMLHLYAPNYDEVKNPISRVFEFGNRKMNSQLAKMQAFLRVFVRPQTPIGWRKMDRNAMAQQQMEQPPTVGQGLGQGEIRE